MRCRLERAVFLLLLIIAGNKLFAQTDTTQHVKSPVKPISTNNSFRTWSIGLNGGISTPYTLIASNAKQDFTSPDIQYSYGIYIKDQLSNSFGLQADLMTGKLQADHAQQRFANGAYIYSQFDTRIGWSASFSGNFVIAHIHGKNNRSVIQPYVTLGGGIVNYTPTLHSYFTDPTYLPASSSFFVPVGVGFKFDLARGINLDLGYQVNFVMADNVDGYKYGSNNDKFSYTHIGLEFALGKSSKPQLAAQVRRKLVQQKNLAPQQPLIAPVQIPQPVVDSEAIKREQVKRDLDSTNARIARLTMDSDGDGVPDIKDKCPNTPPNTKVDTSGCPLPVIVTEVKHPVIVVTDEDKRIISVAAKSVEFYTRTEIISGRSFANLNSVVKLVKEKILSLKIDAYTNKTAASKSELALAKLRAEAVKNYLVNRGVDASKINVEGHSGFTPGVTLAARRQQPNAGLVRISLVQ